MAGEVRMKTGRMTLGKAKSSWYPCSVSGNCARGCGVARTTCLPPAGDRVCVAQFLLSFGFHSGVSRGENNPTSAHEVTMTVCETRMNGTCAVFDRARLSLPRVYVMQAATHYPSRGDATARLF